MTMLNPIDLRSLPRGSFVAEPEGLVAVRRSTVRFDTGSPPIPVDGVVKQAMGQAVAAIGELHYPPTDGDPALRTAIAELARRHDQPYAADEVLVTHGAMQALFLVCRHVAAATPGAEVLLPAPYWFQFPHVVRAAGAVPVTIPTADPDFRLTPALLERFLTPKSRLLLLTQPNNPTGGVYSQAELTALARVIASHRDLLAVDDRVYDLLVLDGAGDPPRGAPALAAIAAIRDQVVTVSSCSKNWAMSGLRVGWLMARRALRDELVQLQRFTSLGVNVVHQAGARAAVEQTSRIVGRIASNLVDQRKLAAAAFASIPRFRIPRAPVAAFYFWVDVRAYAGCRDQGVTLDDDVALADYLRRDADVAVVAGTHCGIPGYFRMTFALPKEEVEEGVERMTASLVKLRCRPASEDA